METLTASEGRRKKRMNMLDEMQRKKKHVNFKYSVTKSDNKKVQGAVVEITH
jgi:hypothetical protein